MIPLIYIIVTPLRKYLFTLLIILGFFQASAQYMRPYRLALTLTNPLGVMNKYGGGLEYRFRNVSYMYTYYKYICAYSGTSMDLDIRVYLRKIRRVNYSKWTYQNFLYTRGILGDAAFEGPNLTVLGYSNPLSLPEHLYVGGAAGFGRRYSKGILFATVRAGLRGCVLPDISEEDKDYYRIFYATGPGSILELNFQFGIQI